MSSLQILIQDQIAYSRWNFCFMKGRNISDKGVMESLEAISNYLKENIDTDDLIIVGNKDNDVKVESHEFQKDEK